MKLEKSNMGIRNIIIISLLLGGSLLIYLMYRIGFTVTPNYAPEEDVYGIPYNIGFQFPAILGALGVVFLQSSFWAMMSCRRNRIFLALACGVWLFFAFVPFEIASSTKTYMWFELGEFGYELDVTKISEEDKRLIPQQVVLYHKYNEIIRSGDYYRLLSYGEQGKFDAWQVVSKDKSESIVFVIQVLNRPNYHSTRLRLKGLSETEMYNIEGQDQELSGGALMHAGILIEPMSGDFKGKLIYLKRS